MMNEVQTTQQQAPAGGAAEKLALTAAILLVAAGIVGFYWLSASPDWQRWLTMVGGLLLGVAVFMVSPLGRRFWAFVLDSRIELRKVVWPNREETLQTTLVVLGFVVVAGLFFWLLDALLAWATRYLTGQGA
jgi:preprotein translocase subunit SecE